MHVIHPPPRPLTTLDKRTTEIENHSTATKTPVENKGSTSTTHKTAPVQQDSTTVHNRDVERLKARAELLKSMKSSNLAAAGGGEPPKRPNGGGGPLGHYADVDQVPPKALKPKKLAEGKTSEAVATVRESQERAAAPSFTQMLQGLMGEQPMLLSLAVQANPADFQGLGAPLARNMVRQHLANPDTIVSCHPTAAGLVELLGTGERTQREGGITTAEGRAAVDLARQAIQEGNRVIHVQYTVGDGGDGHSFALLATPGGVESLEGWAGTAGHGAGHPSFALHQSIQDARDHIPAGDARAALSGMLNGDAQVRGEALAVLSREDDLSGFENGRPHGEMFIRVTVRELASQDEARGRIEPRMAAFRTLTQD